jgi:hypothetical protein
VAVILKGNLCYRWACWDTEAKDSLGSFYFSQVSYFYI